MKREPPSPSRRSIRRHLWAGVGLVVLLVGGVGGWAATAELSGALIAPGALVVDTNVKKVQHPTGGIVGELRVREGDRVQAGDILLRLDETVTRANLAIVIKSLNELGARKARLEGERDGAEQLTFPPALLMFADDPAVEAIMTGERRLFELRRSARTGQKAQLRQRIGQLEDEITGLSAQQSAKGKEVVLIERELEGVRDLFKKNLIQINRLTSLEREATRLEGERGQLIASMAQAKGKISETQLQIIQIDQELSSEVAKEMREIDAKVGEFVERKVAAEDQLKRIEIKAPIEGVVHQLAVHTIGGVISAGEPVMLIVPEADLLLAEAKVNPQDIDQVVVGQQALLRFSTYSQRTTPELRGTVTRISADTSSDQRTGLVFYTIRIGMPREEIAKLGDFKLISGMPVEAFVQTGDRTFFSYLLKPLSDQFTRAFREK